MLVAFIYVNSFDTFLWYNVCRLRIKKHLKSLKFMIMCILTKLIWIIYYFERTLIGFLLFSLYGDGDWSSLQIMSISVLYFVLFSIKKYIYLL